MVITTVCVIGAGSSGLAVIKECTEKGLSVTAYERSESIGGRWTREKPGMNGVWKELCLNLTRRFMEFGDFPWDETTVMPKPDYGGLFPSHYEMTDYLEAYANRFDLLKCIHFSKEVRSIQQQGDGWEVVVQPVEGGKDIKQKFDALVICTGLYSNPHNTCLEQLKEFQGKVMHSQEFLSNQDYEDKSVLTIGSSISSPEIACTLAKDGKCRRVTCSMRHVPYHVAKISPLNGRPFDELLFCRFPIWLGRYLPDSLTTPGLKAEVMQHWPDQLTKENSGVQPNPDIREASLSTSECFVEQVQAGNLKVKPAIQSARGTTVTFADGSKDDFDIIICGTGYNLELSFLPEEIKEKICYQHPISGRTELELYKYTLVPGLENLAFTCATTFVGSSTVLIEMQARYIAATFSGKVKLPSETRMKAAAIADRQVRQQNRLSHGINFLVICEELGDELGVTPSLLQALWEPKKYLFGPIYSCCYRTNPAVDGQEKAKECRERFEYFISHPQFAKF